jgi:virulence factor Mce-like protein
MALACLVVSGITVGVRAAYGAFDETLAVTGTFPRAGQSLTTGSDVLYRGVPVGEVRRIELVGQEVEITLALARDAEVPVDVEAVIAPKTLFGEKSVELRGGTGAPYLTAGDELTRTRAGTEVEELIAAADPLLRGIDTTELAALTTELTQVLENQGRHINRAFEPTVAAAGLLEETLDAQLRLVDSAGAFAEQVRDIGPGLNATAENLNLLLPTLNRARADYVRFLRTVRPLADSLSEVLVEVRPDIDRLLVRGGNISRLLIAREDEVADTVNGLALFLQTIADGVSEETFEDGTKAAFFKVFIVLDDLEAMLCALVDPAVPLPPELSGVLDAVGAGLLQGTGLLDCGDPGSGGASGGAPALEDLAQPYLTGAAAPDPSRPGGGLDALVDGALPAEGAP